MVPTNAAAVSITLLTITGIFGLTGEPPPPKTSIEKPKLSVEARADIMMARKMYREAIDLYSHAPQASAACLNKTGIAYHQLQDLRDAKKSYEEALRADPQFGEARNNLGTIYYSQKSYRRAIREYKRALRDLPDSASVYSNIGTAYFARQDYKKASLSYDKALQLDPDVFEHHSTYGVLMQDHSVADRAKFHYYLAKMYAKQGITDRALQYVRRSLEEGFGERKKFMEDPEFSVLRNNVEFQQILKSEPRVL